MERECETEREREERESERELGSLPEAHCSSPRELCRREASEKKKKTTVSASSSLFVALFLLSLFRLDTSLFS